MDRHQNAATLSTRRSAQHLPSIQPSGAVTTARQQSADPHSAHSVSKQDVSSAQSTPTTPSLRSKSSKMSLFGLFSRPKVEKQRGYHSERRLATLVATPSESPERPSARHSSKSAPTLRTEVGANAGRQSRQSSTLLDSQDRARKHSQKSLQKSEVLARTDSMTAAWTPPPLFQAYPQAINYITLEASTISANAIMRARKHRRQYSLIQETMKTKLDLADAYRLNQNAAMKDRDQSEVERRMSVGPAAVLDFTKKTYVLVTSGYLLQYAGDGPSDRVPEKCLQLGEDSAAFACDLIEGRHYVLQVCQRVDGEGKIASSKSILSKLRLPSSTAPRTTSSILMIFENPKGLDLWMTLIRREIEAFGGGTTYRAGSDTGDEDEARPVEATGEQHPSHRYQVRRDPNQFSSQRSPTSSGLSSPRRLASDLETATLMRLDAASDMTSLRSSQHLYSMPSLFAGSNGDRHLSGLPEGVPWLSHVPMGSRQSVSSPPVRAPSIDDFPLPGQAISTPYETSPYTMSTQASENRPRSAQEVAPPSQPVTRTSEPYQRRQRHRSYDIEGGQDDLPEPAAAPLLPVTRPSYTGSWPLDSGQSERKYATSSSRNAPSIPPTIIDETLAGERSPPGVGNRLSLSSAVPRPLQPAPRVAARQGRRPSPLPIRVASPTAPPLPLIPAEFAPTSTASKPSSASQPADLAPPLPQKSLHRPASMQQIRANHAPFLSSISPNPRARSSMADYPSRVPYSPVAAAQATHAAKSVLQGHYSRVPAYGLPPLSAPPPDTPLPRPPMPVSPPYLTA